MSNKGRIIILDVLKGVGIILIITAHTLGYKNIAYPFIYVFHVPLFFIVSGYLYKQQSIWKQLKKDFKRLIIPYIFISSIEIVLVSIHQFVSFHRILIPINLFWESISPIWFLPALLFSRLIFNLILKYSQHYFLISLFISSFFDFLTSQYGIRLPFSISSGGGALLFLAIGFFVKQYNVINIIKSYSPLSIAIGVLFWFNSGINGKVDTFNNIYELWIIDYIGAVGGVYVCFRFCQFIVRKTRKVLLILENAGIYSMVILSFHSIEYIFPQWFKITFILNDGIIIPAILLCRFIMAYASIQLTRHIRVLRKIFCLST